MGSCLSSGGSNAGRQVRVLVLGTYVSSISHNLKGEGRNCVI